MSVHISDELFSAEIDGALTAAEAATLAEHLAGCAGCRQRRDLMGATAGAVAALPPLEPPRPVDLSFLRAPVAGANVVEMPRRWQPPRWVAPVMAAAAVFVVALTVGPGLLNRPGPASTASNYAPTKLPVSNGGTSFSESRDNSAGGNAGPVNGGAAAPGTALQGLADSSGDTHVFADAGGLALSAGPAPTSVSAGQAVPLTVRARAGQAVSLSALSIRVRQGSASFSIARSSASRLGAGEQAELTATWTAGQAGGPIQPGDYVLEASAILADGRSFNVSFSIRVN